MPRTNSVAPASTVSVASSLAISTMSSTTYQAFGRRVATTAAWAKLLLASGVVAFTGSRRSCVTHILRKWLHGQDCSANRGPDHPAAPAGEYPRGVLDA